MILGIDVGNTNIVAWLIDEKGVHNEYRYETDKKSTHIYHQENLKELIKGENIEGVIVSSVVPEINNEINQAIINEFKITPMFVNANLKMGITIKYVDPNKLGADLITGAVGAVTKYNGGPLVIIDIGTATTFSVVNGNNEYIGGMIAPGPKISMKALAMMASQLKEIELNATDKVIGTTTEECMKIGTMTAHSAMIDGMLEKVINELKEPNVKVIATGGEAKEIMDMCKHEIFLDQNLIAHGLYEIYKENIK